MIFDEDKNPCVDHVWKAKNVWRAKELGGPSSAENSHATKVALAVAAAGSWKRRPREKWLHPRGRPGSPLATIRPPPGDRGLGRTNSEEPDTTPMGITTFGEDSAYQFSETEFYDLTS
jgi:hypothetical protein